MTPAEIKSHLSSNISVPNFLTFCQSKPADETFIYSDNENCALAQFAKSLLPDGVFDRVTVSYSHVSVFKGGDEIVKLTNVHTKGVINEIDTFASFYDNEDNETIDLRRTFGGLSKRVEKAVQG